MLIGVNNPAVTPPICSAPLRLCGGVFCARRRCPPALRRRSRCASPCSAAPAAHVIKPLLLTKMWNIMVFADESHTSLVRVLQMRTVKDVGTLVHLPASTVSNFYHRLIKPKGALKYIAMFKA